MTRILVALLIVVSTLPAATAAQRRPLTRGNVTDIALLVKLEDTRQFDETVLVRLLGSTHPEVRRRAVVTVGRIVHPRGSALLEPLRKDPIPNIVATVAFATGQLKDPATVPWLASTLLAKTTPAPVAFEAARALGKIRTPEAWAALSSFLMSATATATATAAPTSTNAVISEALFSIGRFTTREDIAPIVKWTTATDPDIRWHAAWALFRPRNPAALPHLMRLTNDPSADVRVWAVRGLSLPPVAPAPPAPGAAPPVGAAPPAGTMPPPPVTEAAKINPAERAAASARLRSAVRDSDRRVRTEALRALDGYDDDASVGVVLAALDDADTWMSVSAAEILGRVKGRIADIAPRLAAATAASRPAALRVTALTPLVQLGPPLALDAAAGMMRDPNVFVRTAATQAVRRMGPIGQPLLDQMAADPTMKDLLIPAPPAGGGRQGAAGAAQTPPATRTDAEYRAIVERWIVPAYNGAAAPRAVWMTPKGEIELQLHASEAPLGMEELVRLTESGAIVGTAFSRVVPNFVAQQATIRGANRLRDEVSRLGLTRGNLAWASSGLDTGRAGYTLGNAVQPHNEGDFTALGRIIRGMEAVDRLELGDTVNAARMVK